MTPEETKAWIWSRCEECGDCMEWTKAASKGMPVCRLPGERKTSQARRALMEAMGRSIKGRLCTTSCGNPLCMAEGHVVGLSRKALQTRTAKVTNYGKRVSHGAKISAARRKTAKLTLEQVHEMRERGLTSRQAAKEYQVTQSTANMALSGRTWKDYSSPFTGLMR